MITGKKDLLAAAFDWLRPLHWLAGERWNGLLVFNYHRIGTSVRSSWDRALWSASADDFAAQVRFLRKHFDVVGVRDLESVLQDRSSRAVMLTFDDGYCDNHDLAFPILSSEGATATFFITTGFLDDQSIPWWDEIAWMIHESQVTHLVCGPWTQETLALGTASESTIHRLLTVYKHLPLTETEAFLNWLAEASGSGRCHVAQAHNLWMTWDMVRALHQGGMSIGGHTVTHPVLTACDHARQKWEIETSKQRIEQELGASIEAFSYPVGQPHCFDETTRNLVQQAGFRWAFSFFGRHAAPGKFERFALPRLAVSPHIRMPRFRSISLIPHVFAG